MPEHGPCSVTHVPSRRMDHPSSRLKTPHALIMMLLVITAAAALTWIIESGSYQRTKDGAVIPGSFHVVTKDYGGALRGQKSTATVATPASPLAIITSIPTGMARQAPLIFMILFVGGMFGVLMQTGALESGIARLLAVTRGNVKIVVPMVMLAVAAGST